MLRKMRKRVIIAAMLAFLAVIVLIGSAVNIVNYIVVTNNADDTLQAILDYEKDAVRPDEISVPGGADIPNGPAGPDMPGSPSDMNMPPMAPMNPFRGLPDLEMNYMTRFFVVRLDGEGKVTNVSIDYIASIDAADAALMAERISGSGRERGYIGNYRYVCDRRDDSGVVVFLNTSKEIASMKNLLMMTFAISGVSLVIVFILVALFSKRAIRPIARNIEQQKQFITDASHELKTPLTSIQTSLDVLSMDRGEDEWTENIRSQTKRMSKLVNELVVLSRLDEEIPLPDKEEFSLSTAAWETAEVFKVQAKGAEKKFSFEIEDDISMMGDKSSIQRMLSVLLDNAIKYSDESGEIRFSVFKKGNHINIEVFNTCDLTEIPDTDRLFDRFYRPDSSRSTKTGGYGVGMAIAKAVCDAHGGKISALCPSGKTMTIRIKL